MFFFVVKFFCDFLISFYKKLKDANTREIRSKISICLVLSSYLADNCTQISQQIRRLNRVILRRNSDEILASERFDFFSIFFLYFLFLSSETTVISVFVSKSLTIVDKQDIGFLCSQDAIVAPSILLNLSKSNILSRIP